MVKLWVKYVILVFYIGLLLIVGVAIGILGPYQCVRKTCIRKAKYILTNMNTTRNPCEDFYKYTCENFSNVVKYRKKGVASCRDHIVFDTEKLVEEFLQAKIIVTDDRILKIIKNMYQPCVNRELINLQGVQPLWDAIWMVGGFPVVSGADWNDTDFTIGSFSYKSRKSGFTSEQIFQAFIYHKKKLSNKFVIYIKPPEINKFPGFEIVDETYSPLLHSNYLSFLTKLVFHLLNKPGYAQDKEISRRYNVELNETIDFKRKLGQFIKESKADSGSFNSDNIIKLKNLQNEIPFVDWKSFFTNMLPSSTKLPKEVVVVGMGYFKSITKLIKKTPKRAMANFLVMENVLESCLFLPTVFFSIYNKFRTRIGKTSARRHEFCKKTVDTKLKGAFSSLFLEKYNLTEHSQLILRDIVDKMTSHIKHSIENLNWMDKRTKKNAILKLNNLSFVLSLPDEQLHELQDKEARAEYYEGLCLGTRLSHVLLSYYCINKFFSKKNWELLSRKPSVFDEFIDVYAMAINYNQDKNELFVPYNVLAYPVFDGFWPGYLNYGGIGSELGVTITHGFDCEGRGYNNVGIKAKWWTPITENLFIKHIQCREIEYLAFIKENVNQLNLTGRTEEVTTTLTEQISSFEGVNLAYHAYFNYSKSRYLKEQTMPGLENFTDKQLFFIGFANNNCAYYNKRRYDHELRNSIPYDYRVIGSLQNFKQFSEAFNCKPKDYMNPTKKCQFLWLNK